MAKKWARIVSMFLVIQVILSVFSTVAFANDAVMLEPLIEPNTKSYSIETVSDQPGWFGNHYESKYINFAYYYKEVCNTGGTDAADFAKELADDPRKCFSLDDSLSFDGTSYTGYGFFLTAEGYVKDGNLITNDDDMVGYMADSSTVHFPSGMTAQDGTGNDTYVSNNFEFGTVNDFRVLTFPAMHGNGAQDVTAGETDYAINVGNTLVDNLNSLLITINGGKKFTNVSELIAKSIAIRPSSAGYTVINNNQQGVNNYVIIYGTKSNWSGKGYVREGSVSPRPSTLSGSVSGEALANADYPNVDRAGNLLAYAIPIKSDAVAGRTITAGYGLSFDDLDVSAISSFIWAMPKGYMNIEDLDGSLKFTDNSHSEYTFATNGDDVPWITIHQLTMYANNAYKNKNISMASKESSTDSGNWLMALIVEFFQSLLQGLRTVLGMSDTQSLIYNKGLRGSSSYNYGAMSDSWWTVVLRYHLIFQSLAWFIIICGFIKVLIDLNLSTVNPGKRMSVFQTIERFIVVGFLLVTIVPITQFLLNMNNSLVQIFASQVDPNTSEAPIIGSLAGLVLQFAYFAISVYINFTYIMRSVVIGILVVTAPFFIASMAFSQANKQLFDTWLKELLANIFMQSVHAFSYAFLSNLISNGNGLESLVLAYSIIPITELIRNLIFQGAGQATSQLGKAAGAKFLNTAQSLGGQLAGNAAGLVSAKVGAGDAAGELGAGGASGGKSGSGSGVKGPDGGQVGDMKSAINSKMTGMQNAIKERAEQQGGRTAADSFKLAGLSAVKAGTNFASASLNAMGAAMDMAGAEMTGDAGGYKTVGSRAASAIQEYGASGGTAAAAAKNAVAGTAEVAGQAYSGYEKGFMASRNNGGSIGASIAAGAAGAKAGASAAMTTPQNPNVNRNIRSIQQNSRTGETSTQFMGEAGATFSNVAGGSVQMTMSKEAMENIVNNGTGPDVAGYRRILNLAQNPTSTEAQEFSKSSGVSASYDSTTGQISVNFNRNFAANSGFTGMTASKDGKSMYVSSTGKSVNSFISAIPQVPMSSNTPNVSNSAGQNTTKKETSRDHMQDFKPRDPQSN